MQQVAANDRCYSEEAHRQEGRRSAVEPGAVAGPSEQALAQLAADRGPLRRQLARIAHRLVATDAFEALGYVRAGDHARERLGISGRELLELARVGELLERRPRLADALASGRLGWTKVRLLCRVVAEDDEPFWLHLAVRIGTDELAARVRRVERDAGRLTPAPPDGADERARIEPLRVRTAEPVPAKWGNVQRLARRVEGRWLSAAECAERMAAEVVSALPVAYEEEATAAGEARQRTGARPTTSSGIAREWRTGTCGAGWREGASSRGPERGHPLPSALVARLGDGLATAGAAELDARMRLGMRLERSRLARMGPLLAAVADRRLYRDLGFRGLDAYARERLGMSPRKARALLRLERACARSAPLRDAWQSGRLSWSQAQALVAIVRLPGAERFVPAWIEHATRVTVRRLEDDIARIVAGAAPDPRQLPVLPDPVARAGDPKSVGSATGSESGGSAGVPEGLQVRARPTRPVEPRTIRIGGERELTRWLRACLATVRLHLERLQERPVSPGEAFEAMCDHVLDAWTAGERALPARERRSHAVFERDGWRCTVPGCRSYANLHDHHIRFRSRGGDDRLENRTTVCAAHHLRGVHAGRIRIEGSAPDGLRYALPLERFRSGDVRC